MTLFRHRVSALSLDGMLGSAELLSTFDADDMPTEALLFRTGYLTVAVEFSRATRNVTAFEIEPG